MLTSTAPRVLVACEYSATVRDAFRRRGFDAWSCDLDPCDGDPQYHVQGDALALLDRSWDLMIAHPPCTYLANSGARWFVHPDDKHLPDVDRRVHPQYPDRWRDQTKSMAFFMAIQEAPIPRIAIENPIPLRRVTRVVGQYTQTVQPYEYGTPETKRTCLWLKNLPPLVPTNVLGPEDRKPACHHASPGPNRGKIRSRFSQGLADAMVYQWGRLLTSESSPS